MKYLDLKRFLVSTFAAGTGMWLLAGLWHEMIVSNFYLKETGASHEGTGIIFLAYLVLGILMAYIYPFGYKGGRPAIEGLKFGVLMGVLWVFPHELVMAGAHGESISYVIKNAIWHMVEQGSGGVVIGLIYGKKFKFSKDAK